MNGAARGVAGAALAALALHGCLLIVDFDAFDPSRPPLFDEGGAVPGADGDIAATPTVFTLSAPPSIELHINEQRKVVVTAHRTAGDGAITIAPGEAPGVVVSTATIERGQDSVALTLIAPNQPPSVQPITITLVGTSGNTTRTTSFELTVLPPAGTPDMELADGGAVELGATGVVHAGIDGDGRVVTVSPSALTRYLPDGGVDSTYGDAGRSPVGAASRPLAVAFGDGGDAHVSGYADDFGNARVHVTRAGPDGEDPVAFEVDAGAFIAAPAPGAGGQLATTDGGAGVRIVRLADNGALDPTYVFDPAPYAASQLWPQAIHDLGATGAIVFGEAAAASGAARRDFAVLRVTEDGAAAGGFGARAVGLSTVDVGAPIGGVACQRAQLLDGSGRIYVAGSTEPAATCAHGVDSILEHGSLTDLRLYRVDGASGALDTTFGGSAGVRLPAGFVVWASGLALQPDGQLLVAGGAMKDGVYRGALLRVRSDGMLDPTFSMPEFSPGVLTSQPASALRTELLAVRYVSQRIVAVGRYLSGGGTRAFLVRLIP